VEYQEGGQIKSVPARELNVMMLVKRAVNGDVDAALTLLKTRNQAEQRSTAESERFEIVDWLSDHAGQTAEQKTVAYLNKKSAATTEWWAESESSQAEPKPRGKTDP
jgi:hypothetical protein